MRIAQDFDPMLSVQFIVDFHEQLSFRLFVSTSSRDGSRVSLANITLAVPS